MRAAEADAVNDNGLPSLPYVHRVASFLQLLVVHPALPLLLAACAELGREAFCMPLQKRLKTADFDL